MLKWLHYLKRVSQILPTLKLNKPAPESAQNKAERAPVRRADPAKRDRSVAPPIKVAPTNETASKHSQRNHRHDGKPHGYLVPEHASERPFEHKSDENRPLRSELRAESVSSTKPAEPKQHKPASVDTRTTPRPDKNEPQYRQAPRRGGKVRDGYETRKSVPLSPTPLPAKQSEGLTSDLPRLSKVMAERGLCSRREADEWIVNGWVKVDGVIIDTLGTRIKPDAEIVISGYATEHQAENVTIILHKPVGYVSGQAEDGYEPAIVLVHPDNQWPDDPELHNKNPKQFQRGFLHGLAPAGRLDIDSTGMLVLTQDGRIARHLIGEDSSVEKEYLVRVQGELSEADLKRLNFGLSLDGEKLKPAKVSWQNEDQLRFVLREGKKRQIRRMCEMVGLHVVGLKRIRIGSVTLGKLPVGQWRYLRTDERF